MRCCAAWQITDMASVEPWGHLRAKAYIRDRREVGDRTDGI
ncbi:hypothetical protein ROA7745_01120 [Roseovarius aestuarii]|uniref:Uncharacterized protein n=1 Tax=Roseovarius aestuarii TaxID=475083 RepID=A0A1X7BNV5_9RHOB|nr:hypothetical protein ROA7745_01120 [Roseovarius aestuarii]